MDELLFRIDKVAIILWASLLLVKLVVLPLIEKRFIADASERTVTQFIYWSTVLSWLPLVWLWSYVLGFRLRFSWGLIVWLLVLVAGTGTLAHFSVCENPKRKLSFIPHSDVLYAIATQLCSLLLLYVCLRLVGAVPFVCGPVFLVYATIMVVLLLTPGKLTLVEAAHGAAASDRDEATQGPPVRTATIERAVYAFGSSMGASSPISSGGYRDSYAIGLGVYPYSGVH